MGTEVQRQLAWVWDRVIEWSRAVQACFLILEQCGPGPRVL